MLALDLRKQETGASDQLFVAEAPRSSTSLKRFATIAVAAVLVIALNVAGVFGQGKRAVERVLSSATSGVTELTGAREALAAGDFLRASDAFTAALDAFATAEADVQTLAGAGAVLATKPETIQTGSRLVTAGRFISSAGAAFSRVATTLQPAIAAWPERQKKVSAGEMVPSFSAELAAVSTDITAGIADLTSASDVLNAVDPSVLPADLAMQVRSAREQLVVVLDTVQPFLAALPILPDVLGDRVPRKYLLLFQNPDEIRPTGGFIGSIGELTLNDGFVQDFRIRDVYELSGQLRDLPPPAGYERLTNRWGLQDANTSPDFPTSAAQAAWLYEQAGGGTVDGVIAVTADVLTQLARATDGVTLPRFGRVPADDLTLLLSMVIETKLDGVAAPKAILHDVYASLLADIRTLPKATLVKLVLEALALREVQVWFAEEQFEATIADTPISGSLAPVDSDYLLVSDTSLSGNKSDRYTRNALTHETDIDGDDVVNTLTITRTHGWNFAEEARMRALAERYGIVLDEAMIDLLGRGKNVDLLRIFVPAGAELVSTEGVGVAAVTTHEALDRQYFEVTLETLPSATSSVTLTYRVPDVGEDYALTLDQPVGVPPTAVTKIIREDGREVVNETKTVSGRTEWGVD